MARIIVVGGAALDADGTPLQAFFGRISSPKPRRAMKRAGLSSYFWVKSTAEGWKDIEKFGHKKLAWLRKFRRFEQGIPVDETIPLCQDRCRLFPRLFV